VVPRSPAHRTGARDRATGPVARTAGAPVRHDDGATDGPEPGGQAGSSLLEAVLLLALLALLLQVLVPELVAWQQRLRLQAATRLVALRARRLCAAAVASGRAHAMAFDLASGELSWIEVVDGDGDGVRRADVASGIDPAVGRRLELARVHPAVTVGLPPGVGPVPGGSAGQGGLALGRSRVASCGPVGTASTGTVYLRNRVGDAGAVRWYGATARVGAAWRGREDTSWGPLR